MANRNDANTQDIQAKADKKNTDGHLALSLLGSHAGGVLIAVVMCFSLSFFMVNTWGQLLTQLLLVLGYGFPVYSMMWTIGHRDYNKFSFGHTKRNIYRGFKVGAIAAIPVAVIGIAFVVIALGGFVWSDYAGPVYRIINGHVWPMLNMVELNAPVVSFAWWKLVLFVLLPIAMLIAMSGVSYIMGNHDFSPLEKLMYKNKKKKDDKQKEKKKGYDVV